jgi:class 3 adenylate cyclase/DNA-binding CsgD family transcriptional regulator
MTVHGQATEALSNREQEVAAAYAAGQSYKEIARELSLSPTTVRSHLRTIYSKLGVTSKIELARFINDSSMPGDGRDTPTLVADLALELDEAIRRERGLAKILKIISKQESELEPVIDAVLDHALEICEAEFGILFEYHDNMRFRELQSRGISTAFAAWLKEQGVFAVEPETGLGRVASSLQTINIADLRSEDVYRNQAPLRIATADLGKARSFAAIPMLSGDRLIGTFTVYRTRVHPFNDRALELAQVFADQAVIALENVRQFKLLEARTGEVQALNTSLEVRVDEQVKEIEQMGRLKRFLSPAVADALVTSGDESVLTSHRALIATLFCDIRGFTAFCETAQPEETIEVLQTYHEEMGNLISAHGGGVDKRMADRIMVIFNDPLPCEDPAGDAVHLAMAMRERMVVLCRKWKRLGHRLGFGVGISFGYATIGMVGSEGRYDYTASGTTVNLAARLSDRAEDGEILLSPRAYTAVEDDFQAESSGAVDLKGIREPVEIFRLTNAGGVSAPE